MKRNGIIQPLTTLVVTNGGPQGGQIIPPRARWFVTAGLRSVRFDVYATWLSADAQIVLEGAEAENGSFTMINGLIGTDTPGSQFHMVNVLSRDRSPASPYTYLWPIVRWRFLYGATARTCLMVEASSAA